MKDFTLKDWEKNAEEDYRITPISVLQYIRELEKALKAAQQYLTPFFDD